MSRTYPVIRLIIGEEILEFSGAEISDADLVEEINPISTELPIGILEFKILSFNEDFSMFSGGTYQLLSERLPLLAYEQVDDETRLLGKFYLDDWKNISEREFEFKAFDIIGVLDKTDFDGVFWGVPTTLEVVLEQVLGVIGVAYELDDAIKDVEISGWIAPGTYRQALQQICFAAGAVPVSARNENLLILPVSLPSQLYSHRVRLSDRLNKQSIELLPLISSIELISHDYTQGLELEDIFEKELEAGNHKIVFEKPYYEIIVDGPGFTALLRLTESGDFRITEGGDFREAGGEYVFGPNALYLSLDTAGTVTITGYPWLDSKRAFTFTEPAASEFANKKISEATLVSAEIAQQVLDRVSAFYQQRYKQNITLLPSEIRPKDIVQTSTIFQKKILGTVRKMTVDLTGGFLARTDLQGIEPVYVLPEVEPYRRARVGIAVAGAELTRQNMFREYA